MLKPLLRRTWAPKGKTPILYEEHSHQRLSVISAISVPPKRRHLGLFFSIRRENIIAEDVLKVIKDIRKRTPKKIILILDKWSVHRARLLKEYFRKHSKTISVEWLPCYAPELNPTEQVWRHSKWSDLANLAPHNIKELKQRVRYSLAKKRNQQHLLRSFFKRSGLAL